MNTQRTGPGLLRGWREAQGFSQRKLAQQLDGVHQPQVVQWEDEESDERPNLARALELQAVSKGDVPAASWGYTEEQIARVLRAAEFGAAHTASDFAVSSDDPRPSQAA